MAEVGVAEESLGEDTDDQEVSAYLSPEVSHRSKSEYHTVTSASPDAFHSCMSQDNDETLLDDIDLTSEIHDALDEGFVAWFDGCEMFDCL